MVDSLCSGVHWRRLESMGAREIPPMERGLRKRMNSFSGSPSTPGSSAGTRSSGAMVLPSNIFADEDIQGRLIYAHRIVAHSRVDLMLDQAVDRRDR